MNTTLQTRELKLNRWAQLIHECKNSGLSAREWMQQNGIRKNQFYYWQRQLRAQALQTLPEKAPTSEPTQTLVEVTPSTSDSVSPEKRRIIDDPVLSIRIADAVIEVRKDISADLLHMVLQEIRHAE